MLLHQIYVIVCQFESLVVEITVSGNTETENVSDHREVLEV